MAILRYQILMYEMRKQQHALSTPHYRQRQQRTAKRYCPVPRVPRTSRAYSRRRKTVFRDNTALSVAKKIRHDGQRRAIYQRTSVFSN